VAIVAALGWLVTDAIEVFGRPEISDEEEEAFQDAKEQALTRVLGPVDGYVTHALMSYVINRAMDHHHLISRFRAHLQGTVYATTDLIEADGRGPKRNRLGAFELVACIRLTNPVPDGEEDLGSGFYDEEEVAEYRRREGRIFTMLNTLADHTRRKVVQPGDTAEVPGGEDRPPICMVFDEFDNGGLPFEIEGGKYGLLLCMEVHRSEMEYARAHGAGELLDGLKAAGAYPYSDLDREPVA
jgi:hypothetical protein